MNTTFVKENPITAQKVVESIHKAHAWMRANPEEATQLLLDEGLNNGDFDMNLEINKSLQFGLEDGFTKAALEEIAADYIRLGLITSMSSVDDVMAKVWTPVAPAE